MRVDKKPLEIRIRREGVQVSDRDVRPSASSLRVMKYRAQKFLARSMFQYKILTKLLIVKLFVGAPASIHINVVS